MEPGLRALTFVRLRGSLVIMGDRYLAPNAISRKIVNPLAARLGSASVLAVPTRRTGRTQTVPVNVLEHDGKHYLVSVRGESQWVLNLRAAGECDIQRAGQVRHFAAEEVPVDRRAPIIEAYRRRWGWQVASFFRSLPSLDDHPVFVLDTP
jgi:deazaflavin-dependent oxidoreductase (nitroreductase family)